MCTVSEDPLVAPPLAGFPQYQWSPATISPATVTLADGVTSLFTVTNTVFDPLDTLAFTGTEVALPLWLGGGALMLGFAAFTLAKRRRHAIA